MFPVKGKMRLFIQKTLKTSIKPRVPRDNSDFTVREVYLERMALMGIKQKSEDITHEYLGLLIKYFGMSNEHTKKVLQTLDEKKL